MITRTLSKYQIEQPANKEHRLKINIMKKIYLLFLLLVMSTAAIAQADDVKAGQNEDAVFTAVDDEPQFPGGIEAMYQYIASNVNYPAKAKEEKISGRVIVSFVVEKDGTISNAKTLRCPDEILCEEALRVVQAMPKWKPGRVKGKKVRAQFTLPIAFKLN